MSIKVVHEAVVISGLHDQDTVAFDGRKPGLGMTAGGVGIATGFALCAACGQSKCLAILFADSF